MRAKLPKDVVGGLWRFLFPAGCLLCAATPSRSKNDYLCDSCLADLQNNQHACSLCALPIKESASTSLCAECLKSPPVFDGCLSAFVYAQPLEWMIQQLKFNEKLSFAPLLSSLMLRHLQMTTSEQLPADVIIPMPLHPRRLKERGFNQSLLLLEPVAVEMGVPIDSSSCRRVRDTPHQTGKTARQRRQNIKGAFRFDNHKGYKHVIIFDDVITTGSSVGELSKVLRRSGVVRVDVWSLARAGK
jgi:ComF family protein